MAIDLYSDCGESVLSSFRTNDFLHFVLALTLDLASASVLGVLLGYLEGWEGVFFKGLSGWNHNWHKRSMVRR